MPVVHPLPGVLRLLRSAVRGRQEGWRVGQEPSAPYPVAASKATKRKEAEGQQQMLRDPSKGFWGSGSFVLWFLPIFPVWRMTAALQREQGTVE